MRKKPITLTLALTLLMSQTVSASNIIVAEADGNVSKESVDRANELINALPEQLLEDFVDYGYKLYITDKNIAQTYFPGVYNSVKGFFWTDHQAIYVEERSEAVETATVHEFGHYIDYIKGYPSKSTEFQNIYNSETSTFVEIFNVDFYYDIGEFFADGIYRYYTAEYKEDLQTYCPQLTEFIEEILKKDDIVLSDGD